MKSQETCTICGLRVGFAVPKEELCLGHTGLRVFPAGVDPGPGIFFPSKPAARVGAVHSAITKAREEAERRTWGNGA